MASGKEILTELDAAQAAVTRSFQRTKEQANRAILDIANTTGSPLEILTTAMQRQGAFVILALVVLGLENQSIPNLFPKDQAKRIREKVDAVVRRILALPGGNPAWMNLLNEIDEVFRVCIEHGVPPTEGVGDVLDRALDLRSYPGQEKNLELRMVERLCLGGLCIDLSQGVWKTLTEESQIQSEVPQAQASRPPGLVSRAFSYLKAITLPDDEDVSAQLASVGPLVPTWFQLATQQSRGILAELVAGHLEALPNAEGEFGLFFNNPILANGPAGEVHYLERLRTESGAKVLYHRLGTAKQTPLEGFPIDAIEVLSVDGSMRNILFFLMYSGRRSRTSPKGYQLRPWSAHADHEKAFVKLGGCGVLSRVENFPSGLPQAVYGALLTRGLPKEAAARMKAILDPVVAKL